MLTAICQNERTAMEAANFHAVLTNPADKEQGMAKHHHKFSADSRQVACKQCGTFFNRKRGTRTDYCSDGCRKRVKRIREQVYYSEPATQQKIKDRALAHYATNGDAVRARIKNRYASDAKFRERCKQRAIDSRKARKDADPEAYRAGWRDKYLRKTYRITHEEYLSLLDKQCGSCAICGATEGVPGKGDSLAVDHDHNTHKVRGLLCMLCNRAIGAMRDDPSIARNAAAYLEKHNE